MATFQKIVLGVLLLFSLLAGQPSNAQGLKYRGTVGIDYKSTNYGDITTHGDVVYEIGDQCLFVFMYEHDPYYGGKHLVLRHKISLPEITGESLVTASPDGRFVLVVNTCFDDSVRKVFKISTTDWTVMEWTYQESIKCVSNIVNGKIKFVTTSNKLQTYSLDGDFVSSVTIGSSPYSQHFSHSGNNLYFLNDRYIDTLTTDGVFVGRYQFTILDTWFSPLVDSQGNLYVTDYDRLISSPIRCYKIVNGFITRSWELADFRWWWKFIGSDSLLICNGGYDPLWHYDAKSSKVDRTVVDGLKLGVQPNDIWSVTITLSGDILVAERSLITRWSPYGRFLGGFPLVELNSLWHQGVITMIESGG